MTTVTIMDVVPQPPFSTVPSGVTMYGTLSLADQTAALPGYYEVSPGGFGFLQIDGPHSLTFVWGDAYTGQAIGYDNGFLIQDSSTDPSAVSNLELSFSGLSGNLDLIGLVNHNTSQPLFFTFTDPPAVATPELSTLTMLTIGLFLMAAVVFRRKAMVRLL